MEPLNHTDDCYFCLTKVKGFSRKNKYRVVYPDLSTTRKPISTKNDDLEDFTEDIQFNTSSSTSSSPSPDGSTCSFDFYEGHPITQHELNNLVRELNLSKEKSQLLGSRLREKGALSADCTFRWYEHREKEFLPFFTQEEDLVYCCNILGLIAKFEINYKSSEWRLFIDSSKRSLKVVLLHNGNKLPSIPIGHSVHMKEEYSNVVLILEKIRYSEHEWRVCGDLKIISMILGQKSGYTKFPCYLCEFDSRDRENHWTKVYKARALKIGEKNVLKQALVKPSNILIPPLHLKLGIMKQFVKALPNDGAAFLYLRKKFPGLSDAKVKEGVFVGPDIRKLMKD